MRGVDLRRVAFGLVASIVVIGAGGCGGGKQAHKETISEATFSGTWPFTVASGTLRCVPGNARPPLGDVVFNAGGTNYGINGAALHDDFRGPRPIRTPSSHSGPQHFVPVGDVVYEGTTLCSKLGP